MKNLEALLIDLENAIPEYQLEIPAVSKGSVGWHIEHSLLTLNVIIDAVKKSDPDAYVSTFNWRQKFVALTGKIPRGRIKAPAVVQPTILYTADTLAQHLLHSKENIKQLEQLMPKHFFKHPFLGNMNVKTTIRFLYIHTAHHLAIINDIIKTSKKLSSTK